MSLNRLIHSIRDLTLSLNPYRGTRHQPKEKSVHNDSLLDRKRVRLLLRNRPLVLPLMILSFVYLLSISKTKIKTRDKFNSLQSTHIINSITKKIKSSPRMILMKKHSPFLESIIFYFSKYEPNVTNSATSFSLPSWRSRTIFDPTITPSDTALKRLMSSSVDTPKPVRTGMSA